MTLPTLGALRGMVAKRLDIIPDEYKFLWIVDFPFFEKDEESLFLGAVFFYARTGLFIIEESSNSHNCTLI